MSFGACSEDSARIASLLVRELEQVSCTRSTHALEDHTFRKVPTSTPLRLDIQLRLGRLLALTTLVIIAILVLAITFTQGIELRRFPVGSKTEAEKTAIIDDYNSYSGTIASVLGRPLEIFAALLVQAIIVRCAAPSMLRPENSTRAWIATLVMSALMGYLLNNMLNALNVQLRSLETHINCPWPSNSEQTRNLPDDMVQYGMPQRDWQARLLTEALEPKRVRIQLNVTNNAMKQSGESEDLPMEAARAANLVMNGLFLAGSFLPVRNDAAYLNPKKPGVRVTDGVFGSAAVMAGLLPSDTEADEDTQRQWLLRDAAKVFARQLAFKMASTFVGLNVDSTHTQVAPSISFDAVTFEMELSLAQSQAVNKTSQCGPWPALCQFAKHPAARDADGLYEPPMQIQAFAMCLDATGSEMLQARVVLPEIKAEMPTNITVDCSSTSNSSMLVVSTGRRLVADTIEEQGDQGTVTKLRKIYSFTVGQLGWELVDLSKKFNATCVETTGCMGLLVNLSNKAIDVASQDQPTKHEQLLVGGNFLPLRYVSAPSYDKYLSAYRSRQQRATTLVQLYEPPVATLNNDQDDVNAGDILFPHNIRDVRWSTTSLWKSCPAQIENRLQFVIKNHMYIEESLQPAYTAATFFLLQYGVVRKRVAQSGGASTLNFDRNVQDMVVWIPVPKLNAWLTLVGCGLLIGCLVIAIVWAPLLSRLGKDDPLDEITAPHVVARVMLDEGRFPPVFLNQSS